MSPDTGPLASWLRLSYTQRRQALNSLVWGFVAIGGLWAAATLTAPPMVAPRWQGTARLVTHVHGVPLQPGGRPPVDVLDAWLSNAPGLGLRRLLPLLAATAASAGFNAAMGATTRPSHLFKNGLWLTPGYVLAGVAVVAFTGRRPAVASAVGLLAFATAAVLVGWAVVVNVIGGPDLRVPVSVVVLFGIGAAVVRTVLQLADVVLMLAVVAVVGGQAGAVVVGLARRYAP